MTGRTVYVYKDGKVVPKDDQRLEPVGVSAPAFDWRYLQSKVREHFAVPKGLLGEGQALRGCTVLCFGHTAGRGPRARLHLEESARLGSSSE